MQQERTSFRAGQIGKIAITILLAATFLASLVFAADAALHEKLHPNASEPAHQCVITTFQQQHLLASQPAPVFVDFNFGFEFFRPSADVIAPDENNFRFSDSRAPPVFL